MLKEIFLQKLKTQSKTVHNAIITLGDTDDLGKGRHFKSRFLQPGLAGYPGQYGNALIRKENLDKFVYTLRGKAVVINHQDTINDDNKVGEVFNVWFNPDDGWYWCDGIISDETAQNLITDKGWSVSCSYDVKLADDAGGTENNIKYDIEFLDGVFTHLAIVDNPRYERANIVFNSKTEILNSFEGHAGRPGQVGGSLPRGTVDLSNYFTSTPTLKDVKDFLNEAVEQGKKFATSSPDWLIDIPDSSKKKNHIVKSNQFSFMNKSEKNRHNKYIIALEDLLKEAKYLNDSPNTKPDKKPNTEKYHYFESHAKIGTREYKIIFDTEQYFGDDIAKPQIVHLYDIKEIKNPSSSANVLPSVKNLKEESINSITDTNTNFNPKEQGMLNNVENDKWITKFDKEGEPYHVNIDENNERKGGKEKRSTRSERQQKEYERLKDKIEAIKFTRDSLKKDAQYIDRKGANEIFKKAEKLFENHIIPINLSDEDYNEISDIMLDLKNFVLDSNTKGTWGHGLGKIEAVQKALESMAKKQIKPTNNKENADMALLDELKNLISRVENAKEGDKEMDKDDKKDEPVKNDKVDKRKLIDEVAGIMKSAGADDELIRTAIGKMEKLSYDKSSAGTADNKKPCNNESEEDEKEYKEIKEEVKEDVENKKKCNNSIENSKPNFYEKLNQIYNSAMEVTKLEKTYVSRAERLEQGNKY